MKRFSIVYIVSDLGYSREIMASILDLSSYYRVSLFCISKTIGNWDLKVLSGAGIDFLYFPYKNFCDLALLFLKVVYSLNKRNPLIVHSHLYKANVIGLTAAYLVQVPNRILTRHHSDFHHQYFPKGVWVDRYVSLLASHIVSISPSVSQILECREGVSSSKIVLIPHGIDHQEFDPGLSAKASLQDFRAKYRIESDRFVVGVVSRAIQWKGIQYIIPAFASFLSENKFACLVLCGFTGPYESQLVRLLDDYLPRHCYRIIENESNMPCLYSIFDCFVHVPISSNAEAFGQVYLEALAMSIPCVFTKSGIGIQLCQDRVNCLVVPYRSSSSIAQAVSEIRSNTALREILIKNSKQSVMCYTQAKKNLSIRHLYQNLTH